MFKVRTLLVSSIARVKWTSFPGFGKIRGRLVLFTADDFTLRAGHADGALMSKTLYMEKLCVHLKLPMIKLVDGASGGGSITNYKTEQGSYLPQLELLSWVVRI
jgi:acetyl-CoA carboxylase carboxyltransferase component